MGVIAIAANPNSSKDVRRLVTHATVIDNSEKTNILRRILAGVCALGDHEIWIMPDRYRLGQRALKGMYDEKVASHTQIAPFPVTDTQADTTEFVRRMVGDYGAEVVIVMGGDGTSRAAALAVDDVPLIAISTGTNNVYPTLWEGTIVAMAAAAIAGGYLDEADCGERGKRIEIQVADRCRDIALIDAAFSSLTYTGAKALLHPEEILAVLATQAHPASIGFSALAGSVETVLPGDPYGIFVKPDWSGREYIAALSAGRMAEFGVAESRRLALGEPMAFPAAKDGTIALDGERELTFRAGEMLTLTITQGGPRKVDVPQAVALAAERGFFRRGLFRDER